jgi:glycosyltransferase involved in cell wall biosynthesis
MSHQLSPFAQAPASRPTLGVVAISHNEQEDLPAFLEHLLPWVDEIVIVDDGSTDATADIALAAGDKVKFLVAPRGPDEFFSHQRNKGIDAASSDWLLHLDIDERVTPELAEEILHAIRDPHRDGYRYRRLNFFLGRPMRRGGLQTWNLVHLARREKFRFGGRMHETCLLDAPETRVGQLRGAMWHLNDADYVERVRKNMLYMQVEARTLAERGARVHWFDLLLRPLWRAFKAYALQGGWREGTLGLLHGLNVFTSVFNWYATAWDRAHGIPRADLEARLRARWQRGSRGAGDQTNASLGPTNPDALSSARSASFGQRAGVTVSADTPVRQTEQTASGNPFAQPLSP